MKAFYTLSSEDLIKTLNTSAQGLRKNIIGSLQEQFGENVLQETKQRSKLSILLAQFADIMILILIIAAIISFVVGEQTDAFVIMAIIVANAWMGYSQESKAEQSIRMLRKMAAQFATVVRENNPEKIETSQLVPGDVLLLEAGDIVPADARLIEVSSLKTDEASLTGESHSIEKITAAVDGDNLVPGDQLNMVFKGTIVSNGSAKAVVTNIGMQTELGKIAGLLNTGDQKTPLQKRLAVFSRQLAVIVVIICVVVFLFGLYRGEPVFQMFLTSLSLAVAALPEALPAVITIALARGASRMVKQNALIRKLPAVETLGSVTVICTDKTGTLTQNIMTVEKVLAQPGKEDLLSNAMLLNNEVKFAENNQLLGDSTETALVHHSLKNGLSKAEADQAFPLLGKLPFDSVRMRMSTLHRYDSKWLLFVKGAPVKIIEVLAEKYKADSPVWLDQNKEWAQEGMRVLFFAVKIFDHDPGKINIEFENDLDFLGMTAMIDPPREEVVDAVRQCKTAGIRTVMITGDQPLTAKTIAERLGIADETEEVMTGAHIEKMTGDLLIKKVSNTSVFARVSPEQKLKIVKILQSNGEFVSMTGDGVNDAPSLKQADIGVAMGITGTDVSKEASDMILLDDNFTTIVKAVREGRKIYENIRKFILYVLSCNLSEILILFLSPLLGFAIPLLPIHILWINLVTDGVPGIALVSEHAEKDIMNRPPRPPKENFFAGGLGSRVISSAVILTIACMFVLWWATRQGYDVKVQQTMVFTTLCFVQLGNALSVRSIHPILFTRTLFTNGLMWGAIILTVILQLVIVYVPFLQNVFKTSAIEWHGMQTILIVTIAGTLAVECLKYFNKRRAKEKIMGN